MTAKTTKKAAVKQQTPEQLQATLIEKQADLLGYRRGLRIGELKNPSIIRATRRDIARLHTALTISKNSKEGEK